MAQNAYHRSNKIRILILVAAVFVLGVIVAVYAGYRLLTGAPEKLIESIAGDAKLSLGKIQQTATRDGKTEWRLDAASARYLESENQVQLNDLTVTFYTESGQEVQLSASDGLLYTETNDINVSGNVSIENEGYTLNTATLNYRHEQRIIFSAAPVVIKRKVGGHLGAENLTLDLNTNLLTLEGNVVGEFQEPEGSVRQDDTIRAKTAKNANADQTINIQADKLVADISGDTAEFSGNVRIHREPTRISADYFTLHYNRQEGTGDLSQVDESAIEMLEARGNVSIEHQDTRALTNKAVYQTLEKSLTLEGPETTVSKGTYSVRGARMVLKGEVNDMTVIGGAGKRVRTTIMAENDLF